MKTNNKNISNPIKKNSKLKKIGFSILYFSVIAYMILAFFALTSCSSDDDNPESNTVAIPDTNFERALIEANIDTNGLNGNILKTDAEAVINLDVSIQDIYSLQGIEAFINLKELYCVFNELRTLDVSNNTNLEILMCFNNYLTVLDVNSNPNLVTLSLANNRLESLKIKNLSNNIDPLYLNTLSNPNLTCIEVDDVNYSFNNWQFHVDSQASFNVNCN